MALVYLAHDEELDRPVAVKLLADNLAGDESFRDRFAREARIAAQLSHPNIVSVFDTGEEDGRPYIVMEYVKGETLSELLARRGRLPPAHAVDLALEVCAGLDHAHASGLVHRDIKPQNLLVREDGRIKIADFGIARAAEATRLTQIGSVLGTAAYLSPEQASGHEVTGSADIYSLGVVLYELLSGRTPYAFDSLAQLEARQRSGAITSLRKIEPAVPEKLEAAVMRCLALDPDERPQSALALAHELAAGSPEPPTEPLPDAATEEAARTRPLLRNSETTRSAAPTARDSLGGGYRRPAARRRLVIGAVAAGTLLAGALALASRDDPDAGAPPDPTREPDVLPVPAATSPAEQARNLANWLREQSR